jgi:hypothetical protein
MRYFLAFSLDKEHIYDTIYSLEENKMNTYTFTLIMVLAVAVDVFCFYDACTRVYHAVKELF